MLFCLAIFLPFQALADGIFVPPIDYYLDTTSQNAVIIHEKGVETLILSTQFKGDAKNFGWVIPVPQRPEISKFTDELFTSLSDLTAPVYAPPILPTAPLAEEKAVQSPVKVLETKLVGIFEVKILEAADPQALSLWFSENKYLYPKEGGYILDEYIRKKWYFVAAKIDAAALPYVSGTEGLKEGHAQPLKIVFKSDKIIYPLRISSLQAAMAKKEEQSEDKQKIIRPPQGATVGVLLYIFADGKKELPGFDTEYAGFVSPKTIKKLAYLEDQPWWQPDQKFYLTRLTRSMTFSEMTEDLYARSAEDNKPVGGGERSAAGKILTFVLSFVVVFLIWIFSLVGLLFVIFTALRSKTKSKTIYAVSTVFQWIAFFLTATAFIVYLLIIAQDGFFGRVFDFKDKDIKTLSAFVFGTAVTLITLIILLVQKARYKKIKESLK